MAEPTCSIDGCECTKIMARGWCGPHYKRWYRHGDPLAQINRRAPDGATADERLRYVGWTEVQRRDGLTPCWEWNGLTDSKGYGRVWDGERVAAAHRLARAAWSTPLADDEYGCHRCDNPPCINPDHVFAGDDVTNAADMAAKARSCNGENRPQTKLTDGDVAAIRAAYTGRRGHMTRLAERYGVTPSYIGTLIRGESRKRPTGRKVAELDAHLARRGDPAVRGTDRTTLENAG